MIVFIFIKMEAWLKLQIIFYYTIIIIQFSEKGSSIINLTPNLGIHKSKNKKKIVIGFNKKQQLDPILHLIS